MLRGLLFPGDILLADRYYASYWNIQQAFQSGYDVVMRAHQRRKIDFRRGFKQGSYDQIVGYAKPTQRPEWMSDAECEGCDDWILVRHASYQVKRRGFRSQRIVIATTLLDAELYSLQDLAELYCRRWQVELDIRSLKTHMQMEHLRCKSLSMVRKEIYAHMIAYNLIRDLIVITAVEFDTSPKRLSHAGAVQALNAFADKLHAGADGIAALEAALLESIMEHPIGERTPRIHPREIKRRPKPYKQMTRPRHAARRSAA